MSLIDHLEGTKISLVETKVCLLWYDNIKFQEEERESVRYFATSSKQEEMPRFVPAYFIIEVFELLDPDMAPIKEEGDYYVHGYCLDLNGLISVGLYKSEWCRIREAKALF